MTNGNFISGKKQYEAIEDDQRWRYHNAVRDMQKWPLGQTTVFYNGAKLSKTLFDFIKKNITG